MKSWPGDRGMEGLWKGDGEGRSGGLCEREGQVSDEGSVELWLVWR